MKLKTNKILTKGPRKKIEIKRIRIKLKKIWQIIIKGWSWEKKQNFYKRAKKKNQNNKDYKNKEDQHVLLC